MTMSNSRIGKADRRPDVKPIIIRWLEETQDPANKNIDRLSKWCHALYQKYGVQFPLKSNGPNRQQQFNIAATSHNKFMKFKEIAKKAKQTSFKCEKYHGLQG